ncbi:hypothetical protein TWF706_007799 [Orbilia oligospora]|nr:hypothetical protein TWF706_007799 [Orbilia oligospora]
MDRVSVRSGKRVPSIGTGSNAKAKRSGVRKVRLPGQWVIDSASPDRFCRRYSSGFGEPSELGHEIKEFELAKLGCIEIKCNKVNKTNAH